MDTDHRHTSASDQTCGVMMSQIFFDVYTTKRLQVSDRFDITHDLKSYFHRQMEEWGRVLRDRDVDRLKRTLINNRLNECRHLRDELGIEIEATLP